MQVKRFVNNPFQEITYILHDESKEAVIIDCGCSNAKERDRITDYISRHELTVVKLLNTHLHIDHVAGNAFIKNQYHLSPLAHSGDLPLYEKTPEQARLFGFPLEGDMPTITSFLNEGETITFGNQILDILHIPGHSPGSICFFNRQEGIIIVGDVIFERSVGRTDLWGGDTDTLINGLKTKILTLGDEVIIAPGHGNLTTVGEERLHNPYLQ